MGSALVAERARCAGLRQISATHHVPLTSIMEVQANAFPKVNETHALQDRGRAKQLTDYALCDQACLTRLKRLQLPPIIVQA